MPGRWMITGTFPSRTEVEKDLVGAAWLEGCRAVGTLAEAAFSNVWVAVDFLVVAVDTESWRSCAHG
jgi:hypothetical protein